ncbi:DUF4843 domain-containing protein [Aestuariibaculum marinum]|uniref:DUF4843 domain-containing protein n=1 Tax=Aestuariibaculum marinum TaxID=2683592 RepID=A0A8J6Q7L6_9FLAO|nr:DUF4843 domain-containing protein [Aestuariibaculum marinum]MBD0824958.1 DUF4843 domain-containing protein [Aestuariibaculum marinum]
MLTDKFEMMKQNVLKITGALLLALIGFTSCSEDAIEPWKSSDYIHFAGGYTNFFSFVYAGSDVQKDTVTFRLNIAGNISSKDRMFKVKQAKSYGFIYEEDDFGNIIDSAFIELPNQAKVGVHFEDFSNETLIVPSDSLGAYFDVVLLRDQSLKDNDFSLSLEVEETTDFKPGNAALQKINLTISDKIVEPKLWRSWYVGNTTVFSVMGYYGKVKHQLIIDATGQRWDDNFIQYELTEEYLVFYKNLAVLELNKINEEREAQGLHKLREDDSNPNSEVEFF